MTWSDYRDLSQKIENVESRLRSRIQVLEQESSKKDDKIERLMSENEMLKKRINTLKVRLSRISKKCRSKG